MTEKRRLYIAYGSNLNQRQMALRCPTAKIIGTTILKNWRLIFNGVASIERSKGEQIPVLVWDIQPEDERALDVYEGWPHLYRKESVRITLNGKRVRAMVYIMNHGHPSPPSLAYYNTILEGYEDAGFDVNILQGALQNTIESSEHSKKEERKEYLIMNETAMEAIREQIMAVRATGKTNMLDTNMVQRVAYDLECYELVNFIEEDRKAYARLIISGKRNEP